MFGYNIHHPNFRSKYQIPKSNDTDCTFPVSEGSISLMIRGVLQVLNGIVEWEFTTLHACTAIQHFRGKMEFEILIITWNFTELHNSF